MWNEGRPAQQSAQNFEFRVLLRAHFKCGPTMYDWMCWFVVMVWKRCPLVVGCFLLHCFSGRSITFEECKAPSAQAFSEKLVTSMSHLIIWYYANSRLEHDTFGGRSMDQIFFGPSVGCQKCTCVARSKYFSDRSAHAKIRRGVMTRESYVFTSAMPLLRS